MKQFAALLCLVVGLPIAATAQSGGSPTSADPQSNQAICMTRVMGDIPQVAQNARGQRHMILATERSARHLAAKGFVITDCAESGLSDSKQRSLARDRVCELASEGNAAVQNQLEAALGARPAELCALAERVAGEWERKSDKSRDKQ